MNNVSRRQPAALYVCFLTEMWERFGFYTLVSLLVLYLTQVLQMADEQADLVFGAYTSFVYLTTVAGGFIADRLLGYRWSILVGALIMSAGYLLIAGGVGLLTFMGLAILTVGNGLLKPNVGSLLGQQYSADDPRRQSGFILFYAGINIGAMIATFGAGVIATTFGYQWAFVLAGCGKLLAFLTMWVGRRYFAVEGKLPSGALTHRGVLGIPNVVLLIAGLVGTAAVIFFLLRHNIDAGIVLAVVGACAVAYYLTQVAREKPSTRRPLFAMLALFVFAVGFWAVYGQAYSSVTLFTERAIDRNVLGYEVPPSSFGALNMFFIISLAPVFAWLWIRLARSHADPSIPFKFVLGLLFLGSAFVVLRMGASTASADTLMSPAWLVLFFFLFTCGEMSLSPVGLAMVTRYSPARLLGFSMGMWFLTTALANYVGGWLAEVSAIPAGTAKAAEL
ncbi:MAG: peptide MFS transporter, partial [Hyphomicrobiales bacterium]|nr:peptide MFS transporter [Hyphomicrobiales bacterium]